MKIFDAVQFYRDNNIPFVTEGHKHSQPGWVQIKCPFCTGNPGWHLGYSLSQGCFSCWRCGGHSVLWTIKTLLNTSKLKTKVIIQTYKGSSIRPVGMTRAHKKLKNIDLPPGTLEKLSPPAKKYLTKRGYDPEKLEKIWGLKSTGPIGDYKFRIIVPIYFEDHLVSYQGRDFTNRQSLPYKACAKKDESKDHKDCLYGLELVEEDTVVVVEGITDVWRLGPGAVATFGIKFKTSQINLLKNFKRVFVLFDPEPQAQAQARKLVETLCNLGVEAEWLELEKEDGEDPGEMSQRDADVLMKDLMA